MARRTDAYLDTSAVIAFLDRSDSYHPLFRRLFGDPPRLIVSSLVVAETHGWFLRRYDERRAMQALRFFDELPSLEISAFDGEAMAKVRRILLRYADEKLTLADAHGLALIEARRLGICWSTDRHLALGGATLVV